MKWFRVLARITKTWRRSLVALTLLLFPSLVSAAQDRTHRAPERNVAPPARPHVVDLLTASPLENSRRGLDEGFGPMRLARFLLKPEAQPAFDRSALDLSPGSTEYGYQGRERDSESGLQFFRARSYDPMTGRFMSRDPVTNSNLYVFANNNPANKTDPSGRKPSDVEDQHKYIFEHAMATATNGAQWSAALANLREWYQNQINKENEAFFLWRQDCLIGGYEKAIAGLDAQAGAGWTPPAPGNLTGSPTDPGGALTGGEVQVQGQMEAVQASKAQFASYAKSEAGEALARVIADLPLEVALNLAPVIGVAPQMAEFVWGESQIARQAAKAAVRAEVRQGESVVLRSLEGEASIGPAFDAARLDKIVASLERGGVVSVDRSADAAAMLSRAKAGAMWSSGGGRGTLLLGPNPTRLQVVEEMIHYGQLSRNGFADAASSAEAALFQVRNEVAAQDILLRLARQQKWTAGEIQVIERNQTVWNEQLKIVEERYGH